ncbi:CdaR family transcriptional regulator [Lentibacillus sp. Marseille-P4043]|uniref:CdaR family transcriptional regulator n=1 Tax=Lentibacillus sp. Marseille-P4043 TaxID=2040293 RepID=UPI000D0B3392|nr:sugar diacid recognition domain-containing protein [Lentibacillus sp. Marseille-P4043]
MKITSELGQEVIKRISEYIAVDINIMDLNGRIVASTDYSRIDQMHSGAMKVIKNREPVILSEEVVNDYPGTKPGVNLPIKHQDKIKGVVGVSGNPVEIEQVTGIIRASVEIVLEQIHIQHQTYYKERLWNHWVHQLLHPMGFDNGKLAEDAIYSLNIDPKQSWRIIVFTGENIHDYLESIRQEIAGAKINTLFILPFSENEIIVAIDPEFYRTNQLVTRFITRFGEQIRAGVGNVEYGIPGIRNSYMQAKQSLVFARNKESKSISYIEDWKLERLIAAIPQTKYDSICKNYETLLKNLGGEYVKTVEVYLSNNFSTKETANKLHIHRNTLHYRLDQIKDKVGLDPRLFYEAFILKIIISK